MIDFIMMVGLPGSGKSYIANELAKKNANIKVFSSDEYRKMLFGDESFQGDNEKVFSHLYRDMLQHLTDGYDAVFDATNVSWKGRRHILDMLSRIGRRVNKICYVVNTPFDVCVERDANRDRTVTEKVIRKFMLSFQMPQYFEGWDEIIVDNVSSKYDNDSLQNVYEEMNSFDQDNPHHIYTLGTHCKKVESTFLDKEDGIRAKAGMLHDVGKLYTKHFDEYGIAHYYGHDSVGTYEILCHTEWLTDEEREHNNMLDILFFVNYHMRAHKDFRCHRAYNKYSRWFGQEMLDNLLEFADADIEASGTKDCHEDVVKKIEEMKQNNVSSN